MQIDFRILGSNTDQELANYVAESIAKIYSSDLNIAIVADAGLANLIDNELWQDSSESFIPHFCALNSVDYDKYKNVPILITDNIFVADRQKRVINLTKMPVNIVRHKFESIVELVDQEDMRLQSSRKKYVYYKKLGAKLTHQKV